jgi:O-succinylbenzoate synthase
LTRIRGWEFVKTALLDAVHDLWRRQGLDDPLAAWDVARIERVPVGISLGLFSNRETMLKRIEKALADGYRRIKLKIKPGLDRDYLTAAFDAFPEAYLGCDANGSFDETTMDQLIALTDSDLAMIEQPFAPDRLDLCAELKNRRPQLHICLDESVTGIGNLTTARFLKSLDELNIKPGRVGGFWSVKELADECKAAQLPVWIGGMFETGIGRAANLRLAACFPRARAHDLSPSKRYFSEDLVCDPVDMDAAGTIEPPPEPVVVDERLLKKYQIDHIELRMNDA